MLPKDATLEQKAEKSLSDKAISEQKAVVQKLEGDYKKLLAEWEKKYPEDRMIFQSASRVDASLIQKYLKDEWVALQYISLKDKLIINVISNNSIDCVSVGIDKKTIDNIIKNKFLVNYIEKGYGRKQKFAPGEEEKDLKDISNVLHELYSYLIAPVAKYLDGYNRLYIITDGFLAQTPFAALVSSFDNNEKPNFLIEDKEIGYLRPSFIESFYKPAKHGKLRKLLAIANPNNVNLFMSALPGTFVEVQTLNSLLKVDKIEKDVAFDRRALEQTEFDEKSIVLPTEPWIRDRFLKNNYEIIYLATHGMPYSNSYISKKEAINKLAEVDKGLKNEALPQKERDKLNRMHNRCEKTIKMMENSLNTQTPFNGYLYLNNVVGDDVLKMAIPNERDGLLTIKEIRESATSFANTKLIILSACNTGVSFVPKALAEDSDEILFKDKQVEKELINAGFVPGIDQVSFVDTFMSRGVNNVYGTLWFANDDISSAVMSRFVTELVAQGDSPDAVAAFSHAQKEVVRLGKERKIVHKDYDYPHHPYLWAVGAIFGK